MKNIFHTIILLLLFLLQATTSYGQWYDNTWMIGYFGGEESSYDDSLGMSILTFDEAELAIVARQDIGMLMHSAATAVSDSNGDLSFFTNTIQIRNAQDELVENGVLTLNSGDVTAFRAQTILALPFTVENGKQQYSLLRMFIGDYPRLTQTITRSVLDMEVNNGNGKVILKNELIIDQDSLDLGKMTATRHANGRDWWVLVSRIQQRKVFTFLASADTVFLHHIQEVSLPMYHGLGQAVFSPDGSKFVRQCISGPIGTDTAVDVFDFDRCTGQLSNQQQFFLAGGEYGAGGGVAISPNSRYLYISYSDYLYQFDLAAEDLWATLDTVGVYDGYTEWGFIHSRFYLQQLAPDGKIYINSTSAPKVLSVIEYPDQPGELSGLAQHAIQLPMFNFRALANHPNYRLGPLDGSPCDTLGLDNLPQAFYRTDRDTTDAFTFAFHDLSFYEPTTWSWSFGDGSSSTQRHPTHTYAAMGIYEVCLTVSNAYGSDTHCRTYNIGTVGSTAPSPRIATQVFPNPATDLLYIDIIDYIPIAASLTLYDALGRPVHQQQLWQRQTAVRVGDLPRGVYVYTIVEQDHRLAQGKVVLR